MITVVGGVYREYCMHPSWGETYGSAGRATSALAAMGVPTMLHSFTDGPGQDVIASRAFLEDFKFSVVDVPNTVGFDYTHGLATPRISGVPEIQYAPLKIKAERVVRFGMLESDAIVEADYAVYDPQNLGAAVPFAQNGSKAAHLALVLNLSEAKQMSGMANASPEAMAEQLCERQSAEVVVVKMGPRGAMVFFKGEVTQVPAYRTSHVWKIGSGDCFVAHFARAWMHERLLPGVAAEAASKATAYYCSTQGFPTRSLLAQFSVPEVALSRRYLNGYKPKVYLAGPFFTLSQRWMIEQARTHLIEVGLDVFSPFHDVGHGSADDVVEKDIQGIKDADLLFAVGDGMDAGTLYEIGYARALEKPVVMYCENESDEDKKMMSGSSCVMCKDYTTAIYSALWEAARL